MRGEGESAMDGLQRAGERAGERVRACLRRTVLLVVVVLLLLLAVDDLDRLRRHFGLRAERGREGR
jgi:hypothetical protein